MTRPAVLPQKKEVLVVFWSRNRKRFFGLNRKEKTLREIPSLEAVQPKAFGRCLVVLGRDLYILKIVEFPRLKKGLLDKAVKTNIGEWSPFASSKYFSFSYPKGDKVVSLISICKQAEFDEMAGPLKTRGLKIDSVVPVSLCYENFFKGKMKTAAVVRTGDGVELLYFDAGIRESQFIPAQKWTEESLAYFIKRLGPEGQDLKEILSIGPNGDLLKSLPEGPALTAVRADDDMDAVMKGSDFLSSPWVKSFAKARVSLGTPDDLKSLKPGRLIVAGGLILFTLAQLAASLNKVHTLQKELSAIKEQSQGLEEKMDRITALRTNVAFLHDNIERNPSPLAILWELQTCFPEGTLLQRYGLNKDTIEFTGLSDRSVEILSRLSASKFFADVKLKSAVEKDRDTGKERFTIELRLKK